MTLAEAIAHEDWAATTAHGELAAEHAQMRDWLRELERLRGARDVWQENDAKLREQIHWLKKGDVLHVLTDQELADQQKHERETQASITALNDDNAKLQKVCKRMRDHIKDSCDVCDEYYCSSWDEDNECCVFDTYMRELGVVL